MIAYLKGIVADVETDKIIIENNNMGFNVFVTANMAMNTGIGEEIILHTYLSVKEDAMNLFGFATKDELKVFRILLGVSGVGPKGALGILSALTPDELRVAVMSDDSKAISKAPGIGNKTAMKVIIELKDKLNIEDMLNKDSDNIVANISNVYDELINEAYQAMVALGYSQSEAMKAVKSAEINEKTTSQDIIKHALKTIL
ncbi:MAG: Holliday junction branch migration protein RuvA [Lachnospiraceae bacterium]|nr:Holliday junction branch migration protein RuvA [Lachnospiraceae bacterium]MBQ4068881.1 Holliday junction branch migration protein RuvA [Lachnospiraceae bacterium]